MRKVDGQNALLRMGLLLIASCRIFVLMFMLGHRVCEQSLPLYMQHFNRNWIRSVSLAEKTKRLHPVLQVLAASPYQKDRVADVLTRSSPAVMLHRMHLNRAPITGPIGKRRLQRPLNDIFGCKIYPNGYRPVLGSVTWYSIVFPPGLQSSRLIQHGTSHEFVEGISIPPFMHSISLREYFRSVFGCLINVNQDTPAAMKLENSTWHHYEFRRCDHLEPPTTYRGHAFYSVPHDALIHIYTVEQALHVEERYPLLNPKGDRVGVDFEGIRRNNPGTCGIALWVPHRYVDGAGHKVPFSKLVYAWTIPSVAMFDDGPVSIVSSNSDVVTPFKVGPECYQ